MHGGSSGPSVCFLFPVIPMGGEPACGLGPDGGGLATLIDITTAGYAPV